MEELQADDAIGLHGGEWRVDDAKCRLRSPVKRKEVMRFKKTETGRVLAYSTSSPHFCVEGATKEEAKATAKRALRFYKEWKDKKKE